MCCSLSDDACGACRTEESDASVRSLICEVPDDCTPSDGDEDVKEDAEDEGIVIAEDEEDVESREDVTFFDRINAGEDSSHLMSISGDVLDSRDISITEMLPLCGNEKKTCYPLKKSSARRAQDLLVSLSCQGKKTDSSEKSLGELQRDQMKNYQSRKQMQN